MPNSMQLTDTLYASFFILRVLASKACTSSCLFWCIGSWSAGCRGLVLFLRYRVLICHLYANKTTCTETLSGQQKFGVSYFLLASTLKEKNKVNKQTTRLWSESKRKETVILATINSQTHNYITHKAKNQQQRRNAPELQITFSRFLRKCPKDYSYLHSQLRNARLWKQHFVVTLQKINTKRSPLFHYCLKILLFSLSLSEERYSSSFH